MAIVYSLGCFTQTGQQNSDSAISSAEDKADPKIDLYYYHPRMGR